MGFTTSVVVAGTAPRRRSAWRRLLAFAAVLSTVVACAFWGLLLLARLPRPYKEPEQRTRQALPCSYS